MTTKFNPEGKSVLTFGECLHPAMKITDEDDAQQYLRDYVAYIQAALDREPRDDEMTAEQIAGVNLGYFAGYYDNETRERVERLFRCAHPIFGKASNGTPTPQEALRAGRAIRGCQEGAGTCGCAHQRSRRDGPAHSESSRCAASRLTPS